MLVGVLLSIYALLMAAAVPLVFRATRLLGPPQWPWYFFTAAIAGVSVDRLLSALAIFRGAPPAIGTGQAWLYVAVGTTVVASAWALQGFLRAWYDDRERRFRRSVWSSLAEVYLLDPESLAVLDHNRGAAARLPMDRSQGSFADLLASPVNELKAALAPLRDHEVDSVEMDIDIRGGDDGSPRPCRLTLQRMEEDDREVWVAFLVDATARRRAEERARAEEERFRLITESVEEAIVLTDLRGRILYESPSAGPILGFGSQVRLGQDAFAQVVDEDRERISQEFLTLAHGEVASREGMGRCRRADNGEVVVLEYLARRVDFPGEGPSVLISCRDVTERVEEEILRRRVEERLLAQQARLASLSRSAALREGDVVTFSAAVAEALSQELPAARGSVWLSAPDGREMRCVALHHRTDGPLECTTVLPAAEYPRYFEALEEGRSLAVRDAQSDSRTGELTRSYLSPLGIGALVEACIRVGGLGGVVSAEHVGGSRDWTPEEVGFVAELADLMAVAVQEHRRLAAERERGEMAAQLRVSQRMETLGVMAGGIAHDFNNLLTPILGYAEMALEELPAAARPESPLAEIRAAGERAQALVRQLLTFSRKVEQEREPIRLEGLLKEVLRLARASLPSTIEIATELDGEVPPVEGDASQLHQVFLNLCANSGHAMREGGGRLSVSLSTHMVGPSRPEAHLSLTPGAYARVVVTDTGCGMERQTLERVFEPFFTTKAPGEGTGLGMAVTHGIVLGHRGAIDIQSEVGVGTTVEILLPLTTACEEAPEPVVEPERPCRAAAVALVVDDEPAVARFTTRVLERAGCRVHTYTSSVEAAQAVEGGALRPDILVTDQTMPRLTGLNLVTTLRKTLPDLPVILMSGYDAALDGAALHQYGVQEFLRKPYRGEELVRALKRLTEVGVEAG